MVHAFKMWVHLGTDNIMTPRKGSIYKFPDWDKMGQIGENEEALGEPHGTAIVFPMWQGGLAALLNLTGVQA